MPIHRPFSNRTLRSGRRRPTRSASTAPVSTEPPRSRRCGERHSRCARRIRRDAYRNGGNPRAYLACDQRPPQPRIERREIARQRPKRRIGDLPNRPRRMICPDPRFHIYLAEKATANRILAARRDPPSPPQGSTMLQIDNDFFNSLSYCVSNRGYLPSCGSARCSKGISGGSWRERR
jgi:hypothetical protein